MKEGSESERGEGRRGGRRGQKVKEGRGGEEEGGVRK